MGLSSSKTRTTSNTSQNTNQNETGTTTPLTPDWLTQAAQDYVGRIGAFGEEPSIRNWTIGFRHVPEGSATRLNGDLGRNLDLNPTRVVGRSQAAP